MNATTSPNLRGRYIGLVRDPCRLKPDPDSMVKAPKATNIGATAIMVIKFSAEPNGGKAKTIRPTHSSTVETNAG